MKGRLFTAFAVALLCGGSLISAATTDEIRIYINPGHGSWGPNNRPMQTIGRAAYSSADPDTTGFYESNTNLHKAFSLLDHLVEAGVPFDRTANQTNENEARVGAALDMSQHIVMSHVKVGPYPYTGSADDSNNAYNRPLSEIREEVEANNFDIFISIHSNAASEGSSTNYPLFLFRGQDDETYSATGSKAMATHIWPYTYGNEHQTWSYYSLTNTNVRGDVTFYGSGSYTQNGDNSYYGYLGVLKHGVPGFLVEGYFHTYQPARQRAMNDDVCRHEGHLYARGLIDYMGWTAETTGEIYGIVRDLHEKFTDDLYKPASGTNDVYKPLNAVTVTLWKNGVEAGTYTTDNEWNGAFFFTDLEPGEYSLSYSAEGYKAATEEYLASFSVTANETTYINAFLESEDYVEPDVVYENYPDPLAGNAAYSVAGEYNLSTSTAVDALSTYVAGKDVLRQIVRDGVLYVLALDESFEPYIYALNLSDNSVSTISTAGLTLDGNKTLKISDIAFTADNYLVATSYGENQYSDSQIASGDERGYVSIYKWNLDDNGLPTGDPVEWITSQSSGNYNNANTGKTIAYNGTTEDGKIMVTAQTTGSSTGVRFVEFSVYDNALSSTKFINKSSGSGYSEIDLGDDYQLAVSPRDEEQYIVDGSATTPIEWQTAAQNENAPVVGQLSSDIMPVDANGAGYFKYADHDLMVIPEVADGYVLGLKLLDITDGLDEATEITLNGVEFSSVEADYASAAGEADVETDEDGNVTSANINLYLICDGTLTKFTTNGVTQPVIRGDYAYDLGVTVGETQTTFTFKSTGNGTGQITFTDPDTEDELSYQAIEIAAGDNTVVINNSDIPEGRIGWEVEVYCKSVPAPTQIFSDSYGNNRGVVVDNNPYSPYFGTAYVGNTVATDSKTKGVYVYDPTLNVVQESVGNAEFSQGNTASPFRMGIIPEDGTVLISDWSDAHSGLYTLNPATYEIANMFQGTRESSGAFTVDGAIIGGGTTCAYTVGEGADLKLYTFAEDYPTGNAGNVIARYDIGESRTISTAPNATFDSASGLLANTNVEIRATENGVWASQTRSSGNNTSSVPSLIYTDLEGNVLYNSGVSNTELNGSNGSGFAISTLGTRMAIVNGDSNINIYELSWTDNVPTLTLLYTVSNSGGVVNEMVFDVADNLYVASRNAFQVWSLPNDGYNVATPAAETIIVNQSSVDAVSVKAEATKLYPNPATSVVNVKAAEEIASVSVYNAQGALVISGGSVSGNTATIDVSTLPAGIYFVKINDGKAVRFIKK